MIPRAALRCRSRVERRFTTNASCIIVYWSRGLFFKCLLFLRFFRFFFFSHFSHSRYVNYKRFALFLSSSLSNGKPNRLLIGKRRVSTRTRGPVGSGSSKTGPATSGRVLTCAPREPGLRADESFSRRCVVRPSVRARRPFPREPIDDVPR